ncbi:hypothetical protein BS78_K167000 [Paspalum vaginatum]|uniref:Zinc finger, CCHC-type n=1 Tax=Paspalum vaginatum TaxID=158149 RepID=A0A9W7XE06_9POAL|nr:hypothetical protein BS78_K252600 [Paspalum vaginatum]KAJ1257226.1 hypothetical protein BS78_K167000 [Paspalum vaginatum]
MASGLSSSFTLRSIFEKEKLNGTNFIDWIQNLRIGLKQERKEYVLENPIPAVPATSASRAEKDAYKKHSDDAVDVTCLMLATMNSELQKQFENMSAYDMVVHFKNLFQVQAHVERYKMTKALHECKMAVGTSSLPPCYGPFIMNYNMNGLEKSLTELHGMLKTVEQNIKNETSDVLLVQKGKRFKKKGKAKGNNHAIAESSSIIILRKYLSLNLLLAQHVSIAKMLAIGKGTAQNTWKRRRKVRANGPAPLPLE